MKGYDFKDHVRRVEARKKALGITGNDFVPKNSGIARTPEKRALLKALNEAVRARGGKPKFDANY
jgi:hypothetical protein